MKTVLCFSGHDPSGGAGIHADIEAIAANGARAMTVITALTSQNTAGVQDFHAVDADWIHKQALPLLAEQQPDVIKIGMIASSENAKAIYTLCQKIPDTPVVFDPVLAAGTAGNLAQQGLIEAMQPLTHHATLLTPNQSEYDALGLGAHCQNILLTTTDSGNGNTINHRWQTQNQVRSFSYPRLAGTFHGSGCTLASSLAAQLAQGVSMNAAIQQALDYTWQSLKNADPSPHPQQLPKRI